MSNNDTYIEYIKYIKNLNNTDIIIDQIENNDMYYYVYYFIKNNRRLIQISKNHYNMWLRNK